MHEFQGSIEKTKGITVDNEVTANRSDYEAKAQRIDAVGRCCCADHVCSWCSFMQLYQEGLELGAIEPWNSDICQECVCGDEFLCEAGSSFFGRSEMQDDICEDYYCDLGSFGQVAASATFFPLQGTFFGAVCCWHAFCDEEMNEKTGQLESFCTRLGRCFTSPQFKHSPWGCCDTDPNASVEEGREDQCVCGSNANGDLCCLCCCDALLCPSLHATVWRGKFILFFSYLQTQQFTQQFVDDMLVTLTILFGYFVCFVCLVLMFSTPPFRLWSMLFYPWWMLLSMGGTVSSAKSGFCLWYP